MTLEIQNAVANYLHDLPELDGVAIHTATDDKEIPGDQPVVVVSCDNADSPVAGLYRATVQITLSTPAVIEDSLEMHRSLDASLRAGANLSGVSAFFPQALAFSGRHLTSWSEARENDRLHTTAEIVIGVQEI